MRNLRVVSSFLSRISRLSRIANSMSFALSAILLMLALTATSFAQNLGDLATEQANRDAQVANQQMIDETQRAGEEASQAGQQSTQRMLDSMNANNTVAYRAYTQAPAFSVKAGTVAAGTTVRLKSPTRYAVIYYTTNGWSPTTRSKRYEGPITIDTTTQLQAIAIAPNLAQSLIATAKYTVNGTQPNQPAALVTTGVLKAGTRLHLVTASTISSKTAQVGDDLKLTLDQDVKIGNDVVLPKGTPVEAIVTQADQAGHAGAPGNVTFEVKSMTVQGMKIPLKGGESLEGANHYDKAKGFLFVPVVGIAGLAVRGDEAVITPGMTLTASVAADSPLQP